MEHFESCCELCGHPWSEHSPENGCCTHSYGPAPICQCGRDLAFMHRHMAKKARAALATRVLEVTA